MTCDIWTKVNPDLNDANARCRGVVAEQSSKVIVTGDVLIFSGNVSEQENTVGLLLFFSLMDCLKLWFLPDSMYVSYCISMHMQIDLNVYCSRVSNWRYWYQRVFGKGSVNAELFCSVGSIRQLSCVSPSCSSLGLSIARMPLPRVIKV